MEMGRRSRTVQRSVGTLPRSTASTTASTSASASTAATAALTAAALGQEDHNHDKVVLSSSEVIALVDSFRAASEVTRKEALTLWNTLHQLYDSEADDQHTSQAEGQEQEQGQGQGQADRDGDRYKVEEGKRSVPPTNLPTPARISPSMIMSFRDWALFSSKLNLPQEFLVNLVQIAFGTSYSKLDARKTANIRALSYRWSISDWDLYILFGPEIVESRTSTQDLLALSRTLDDDIDKVVFAVERQRIKRSYSRSRTTKADISVYLGVDIRLARRLLDSKQGGSVHITTRGQVQLGTSEALADERRSTAGDGEGGSDVRRPGPASGILSGNVAQAGVDLGLIDDKVDKDKHVSRQADSNENAFTSTPEIRSPPNVRAKKPRHPTVQRMVRSGYKIADRKPAVRHPSERVKGDGGSADDDSPAKAGGYASEVEMDDGEGWEEGYSFEGGYTAGIDANDGAEWQGDIEVSGDEQGATDDGHTSAGRGRNVNSGSPRLGTSMGWNNTNTTLQRPSASNLSSLNSTVFLREMSSIPEEKPQGLEYSHLSPARSIELGRRGDTRFSDSLEMTEIRYDDTGYIDGGHSSIIDPRSPLSFHFPSAGVSFQDSNLREDLSHLRNTGALDELEKEIADARQENAVRTPQQSSARRQRVDSGGISAILSSPCTPEEGFRLHVELQQGTIGAGRQDSVSSEPGQPKVPRSSLQRSSATTQQIESPTPPDVAVPEVRRTPETPTRLQTNNHLRQKSPTTPATQYQEYQSSGLNPKTFFDVILSPAPPDASKDIPTDEPCLVWPNGQISTKDIRTLRDKEWINDEVVNYSMWLSWHDTIPKEPIFIDNSFFYNTAIQALNSGNVEELMTRRAKKRPGIFEYDHYIFPIHRNRDHWILAILSNMGSVLQPDGRTPTILIFDSLDTARSPANMLLLKELYDLVSAASKGNKETGAIALLQATNFPAQQNSYDCGIFMLSFLDQFLANPNDLISRVQCDSFIYLADVTRKRAVLRHRIQKDLDSCQATKVVETNDAHVSSNIPTIQTNAPSLATEAVSHLNSHLTPYSTSALSSLRTSSMPTWTSSLPVPPPALRPNIPPLNPRSVITLSPESDLQSLHSRQISYSTIATQASDSSALRSDSVETRPVTSAQIGPRQPNGCLPGDLQCDKPSANMFEQAEQGGDLLTKHSSEKPDFEQSSKRKSHTSHLDDEASLGGGKRRLVTIEASASASVTSWQSTFDTAQAALAQLRHAMEQNLIDALEALSKAKGDAQAAVRGLQVDIATITTAHAALVPNLDRKSRTHRNLHNQVQVLSADELSSANFHQKTQQLSDLEAECRTLDIKAQDLHDQLVFYEDQMARSEEKIVWLDSEEAAKRYQGNVEKCREILDNVIGQQQLQKMQAEQQSSLQRLLEGR